MYPHMHPYHIYKRLSGQQQKIVELERQMASLKEEIAALEKDPKTVEYHFDQLKIERLEGTLNIGLTPKGGSDVLEDFSVNGENVDPHGARPETLEDIRRKVSEYMDGKAWDDLKQIEQQLDYPLDDPYRRFIFQDIQKQIEPRIRHYVQALSEQQDGDIVQTVTDKVNNDIYEGVKEFIEKLKHGESPS